MEITNGRIALALEGSCLTLSGVAGAHPVELAWPAVALSLQGKEIKPSGTPYKAEASAKAFAQHYLAGGLDFKVAVELAAGPWFRKTVEVSSAEPLPTPDYLETDRQSLPDAALELCGYRASNAAESQRGQEEGAGVMPGCGYPLIGKSFFMGLEHPAAFNRLERKDGETLVWLRHFPVWEGSRLQSVGEVFGLSDAPRQAFMDYLKGVRLPALKKHLVSFCTFWIDPYLGDREYAVSYDAYVAFMKAFGKQELVPDAFTLDAGWNDRGTVFQAKEDVGGDAGLKNLRGLAERMGSSLSLWITHNGPHGIDPGHMRRQGFAVGGGNSSTYSGEGYGVMMDKQFSDTLEARFRALVGDVGANHLKIDWDNDCATNPSFAALCPTRDHVRQASVNEYARIAKALREENPSVVIRNGWWPSPWWLAVANHIWLADSADSEYSSVPSKTQRDSASTYRDVMYYNILRRDKSAVPLDCLDNHEFPDAFRNPFAEDRFSWTNAVWHSFFRGSSYLAYTLQPESLEPWQADSLGQIMKFCRIHAPKILSDNGKMILGHPGHGEVYGFATPGGGETWCMLRNPLPIPQRSTVDFEGIAGHPAASVFQFYPHCQALAPGEPLSFLAHELKLLIVSAKGAETWFASPCMPERKGAACRYRFPASTVLPGKLRPLAHELHQIKGMAVEDVKRESLPGGVAEWQFTPTLPYKMREMELQLQFDASGDDVLGVAAYTSRYGGLNSCYALPVTELGAGIPGYGETKNPDSIFPGGKRYFSARIPAGGQFGLTLRVKGLSEGRTLSGAWLAGYEAPSSKSLPGPDAPGGLVECLPYQNPLGFGRMLEIPISIST